MSIRALSLLLVLGAAPAAVAAADEDAKKKKSGYAAPRLLIEPAQLKKDLAARKEYALLDVRPYKEFKAGHVHGAVWVDLAEWSKAVNAGEGRDKWVTRIGGVGVDGKTPVVVYCDDRLRGSARLWWILRYWGIDDVRLLNGGWKGWLDAGGDSSTALVKIAARTPNLKAQQNRLATKEQLLAELKAGRAGQLLDARSAGEYCGDTKTAKRAGALPGAKHLEWSDTIEPKTGRVKPAPELAKLLKGAGIDPEKPATTYCQSGGRAAVLAFVVELMGGKPARNYYRSWAEWGNDENTPIETPRPKKD